MSAGDYSLIFIPAWWE